MKVLADLHHSDLYYSLHLLFEKRLGFDLYRPIGLEWHQEGFWAVFNHPATIQQYLSLEQATKPPMGPDVNFADKDLLNLNYEIREGVYYVKDPSKTDFYQKAVTLPTFKDMKFDVVISSIPQHIQPFNKLISLYQPQAKHIFQVGNSWGNPGGVKNVLASTAPFHTDPDINTCFYHQEFDLDIYSYQPPENHTSAGSYIHYMREMDLLSQYQTILSDWSFTTYGGGMQVPLSSSKEVASSIQSKGWVWHVKPEGDGYGHILHNAYACGRPTIIKSNYYNGKLGSSLLEDQATCVDISNRSVYDNVAILRKLSHPEEHQAMCERAYQRFCSVVNFDEEEVKIRKFIQDLQ